MKTYRIHPAIGIARVGNSAEYVIAPETAAGLPDPHAPHITGGLPYRAGTEREFVSGRDLRSADGALKRHAARFRIVAYDTLAQEAWPRGDGEEVVLGSKVEGRTVTDIVWSVHVANKKANTFVLLETTAHQGIDSYTEGRLPPIRNPSLTRRRAAQPPPAQRIALLNEPDRVRQLTIDPGPRVVRGASAAPVSFDRQTPAAVFDANGELRTLAHYPKSFPSDSFAQMDAPAGDIDTLGEIRTDPAGRLLVTGGYGRCAGWPIGGKVDLGDDVNNDQWFDDTSDGPVNAVLQFDDGTYAQVQGAWVTSTDPSAAPQISNIVSAWDDVYDCWVRGLDLAPDIYADGDFVTTYRPSFDDQIAPIFRSASLQRWVANLSPHGSSVHARLATIQASDDPSSTELAGIYPVFRNPFRLDDPNDPEHFNTTKMPLALGDGVEPFLPLRKTQYFFLTRWNEGRAAFSAGPGKPLGIGEYLDKAVLANCIGGRFSPGIDVTFVIRDPAIFIQPWQTSGAGPFRLRAKALDYATATDPKRALLTCGYVPRHVDGEGLEPGDFSKFMAIPWHTDYNSCATHPPLPNPAGNRKVFWSWPAQRPVAVNVAADIAWAPNGSDPKTATPTLGDQRWSLRGYGTDAAQPENWGRYQDRADMLANWHRIGVVLQSTVVPEDLPLAPSGGGQAIPSDWYLEVASQLKDTGLTPVAPFPNYATRPDIGLPTELSARELYHKLLNVADHPGVADDARAWVEYWLKRAEHIAHDPNEEHIELKHFPYSEQALDDRLDLIYQTLADEAEASSPGESIFRTRQDAIFRIKQFAPFNLLDGAWLRFIGRTGPMDPVRALLFTVWMDELGGGDLSMHHCNIYRDLCHSVGYHPAAIDSPEFTNDPTLLDSAFDTPAFELAISQFTEEYLPELLGMTMQLEWMVVDLKPTRDLMGYFGIDTSFYVMHIGIDNAVNGHGQRAVEAVKLYLRGVRDQGGDAAAQAAWSRVWRGFVAFQTCGNLAQDMKKALEAKPTPRDAALDLIRSKAGFGSRNHQQNMLGGTRIDEWFEDPEGFLDALVTHDWIRPGDWKNSRLGRLLEFGSGPMFRVFTDDEVATWEAYALWLAAGPPPAPEPTLSPAREMAAAIDRLRPVQRGARGHELNAMGDSSGAMHPLAWWFTQPTAAIMSALADEANGLVTPRKPEESRFFSELIAPTGPMGSVFGLPAGATGPRTYRDVVCDWIKAGCPLIDPAPMALRLNSPPAKRSLHPTGRLRGMGAVH